MIMFLQLMKNPSTPQQFWLHLLYDSVSNSCSNQTSLLLKLSNPIFWKIRTRYVGIDDSHYLTSSPFLEQLHDSSTPKIWRSWACLTGRNARCSTFPRLIFCWISCKNYHLPDFFQATLTLTCHRRPWNLFGWLSPPILDARFLKSKPEPLQHPEFYVSLNFTFFLRGNFSNFRFVHRLIMCC